MDSNESIPGRLQNLNGFWRRLPFNE